VLGGDTAESWPGPLAAQTPADAQGIEELRELLARFVGDERARRALAAGRFRSRRRWRAPSGCYPAPWGRLGAGHRRGLRAARRLLPRSARALIDEASQAISYNYEILRNHARHVGMGIAAFDRDGNVEIFNDRFTALLSLDGEAVAVGVSPLCSAPSPKSSPCCAGPRRPRPTRSPTRDGRVVELRLDPLPAAVRRDLQRRHQSRAHRRALRDSDRQLRRAAETLEQRVAARTAELEASRAEAEAANLGKTRFIAAASHDLLQPLHAARLLRRR